MGFFKNFFTSPSSTPAPVPTLGSGRRLHSDLGVADCLALLGALVHSYRPDESIYRASYVTPGYQWLGAPGSSPHTVVAFNDANLDFFVAPFWQASPGTDFGLFPLGSGDERLAMIPIIGHWKQRDASLTSVGVFPGGLITLLPPHMPDHFFDEILATAGFPSTPRNLEVIGTTVGNMFRAKAGQFLADTNPRDAQVFVATHGYTGGSLEASCQKILDDLGTQYPQFGPYIQDLPMRVRAILLEGGQEPGTVWSLLER